MPASKKKPVLPLRSLWRTAFGDAAMPLLDELRFAFQQSPHIFMPIDSFETYARRIVRHCEAKIPNPELRLAYVQACFANLENPSPELEPKSYDDLVARIGKPAATRFFNAFLDVPLYDPKASEEAMRYRFGDLIAKALSTRYPTRYLQAVIKNGKKAKRQQKPQKKAARRA